MRRADPPVVALPDGEGAVLATYADSDVGSSPRSVSAGGGRAGSLTEEPPPVKWDESAFARVKLMCSYGGRILPRPHDNQLRYVGGESRIAVVSRGITLSELTAKLSRMFGASVVIKYQLPYEDLDALISVTSDEDLDNMMEEYDRLQSVGNRPSASARLRLFLFPLKLERSQTASLLELMENNHSRERWFVDILNGLPVLPHVRSETSSIVSETTDYLFQSNMDTLEEWAAATSYGNSVASPRTEQNPGNKQVNPVSAAALFGSLIQQAGSNEVSSAPGSPLPLKHKQFMMGSSSSAPPAVISLLSAMAEAASKGLPTPTQHVVPASDGSTGTYTNKTRLGSGDGSVGVPEQRKHVDGEILLTSDKGILTSSVGGAEQFLPAGLMDDDDALQKLSAKGSFDEVCGNPQNVIFGAGVSEPSKALKGELASESPALMGQPIFDEEVLPVHILAQNLNVLQLEERLPSPIISPSGVSSASAQISPTVPTPQQPISIAVMSKASADDKLKQQVFPVSPGAGAHMGSEDKLMQQNLPSSAPYVTAAKPDVEDVLPRQVSPLLAHFLPSLSMPQQVTTLSNVVGEDMLVRQIPSVNVTKDAETMIKPQPPSSVASGAPPVPAPSLMPPILHEPVMQKSPAVPAPNYFYQAQASEVPMSTTTYAMQTPGVQLPIMSQTPLGVATSPLPPIAAPFKAANVVVATRPAAGTSRPQSPHAVMAGGGVPQVRATSPPVTAPPIMPTNVLVGEVLKGLAPVATNMSPPTVFSSMGEGVRSIPTTTYPQGEVVNLPRQVSDPLPGHRMGAVSPQLGNQFNVANFNVPPAPGIPTRFRAVGRPIQPVAEGIPLQPAPIVGVISDKKAPVTMQRALTSPSMRPPLGPGGQYSYFMADQPNVIPPRYNTPPNIVLGAAAPDTLPFSGANPFVDNFQPVSTYQDVLEVPPADQQQRRQTRP